LIGRNDLPRDGFIARANESPDSSLGDDASEARSGHLEKERQMGKIALSLAMSLDGAIQSPGSTEVPFKYRRWAMDFDGGTKGCRFNYEEEFGLEAQNAEALLLGRGTYEAMQAFLADGGRVGSPTG